MEAIIVPTDFSPGAYNTVHYAIALATDLKAKKLVLYNAYQPYVSEDPELGLPYQPGFEELRQISKEGLTKMANALQSKIPPSVKLEYESDYNVITSGVLEVCKKHNAELIIMGITDTESKFDEVIIGSSAVDVSKHSETPVIIVPSNAKYAGIKKVLLAVDFKKTAETTPVATIKKLLDITNAQLNILHVEANAGDEVNFDKEKHVIDLLLGNYQPQYHFLQGKDFTDAINQFAVENKADLIIVIPKKHGLFDGIFKRSHSKSLAFHSHIPIMNIHE
jgi:nucleotide-binding universal stress UspA family protein